MPQVDEIVGRRIRAARKARNMSQMELAEAIGVRFQQVQKYENAVNRVSASRLWLIADTLGLEAWKFFETFGCVGDSQAAIHDTQAAVPQESEAARLIIAYKKLSPKQRHAVRLFIESLSPEAP